LYTGSYKDTYCEESLPKIFAPFVRLQLCEWNPLTNSRFYDFPWFKSIQDYNMMIPEMIEKVVCPVADHTIQTCYNPFSPDETSNLTQLCSDLLLYRKSIDEIILGVQERIVYIIEQFILPPFDQEDEFSVDQWNRGLILCRNVSQWISTMKHREIKDCLVQLKNKADMATKLCPNRIELMQKWMENVPKTIRFE
jgi:hypothetical protein